MPRGGKKGKAISNNSKGEDKQPLENSNSDKENQPVDFQIDKTKLESTSQILSQIQFKATPTKSTTFSSRQANSAKIVLDKALAFANQFEPINLNFTGLQNIAERRFGNFYINTDSNKQKKLVQDAEFALLQAEKSYHQGSDDEQRYATNQQQLAVINQEKADKNAYENIFKYCNSALKIFRKINSTEEYSVMLLMAAVDRPTRISEDFITKASDIKKYIARVTEQDPEKCKKISCHFNVSEGYYWIQKFDNNYKGFCRRMNFLNNALNSLEKAFIFDENGYKFPETIHERNNTVGDLVDCANAFSKIAVGYIQLSGTESVTSNQILAMRKALQSFNLFLRAKEFIDKSDINNFIRIVRPIFDENYPKQIIVAEAGKLKEIIEARNSQTDILTEQVDGKSEEESERSHQEQSDDNKNRRLRILNKLHEASYQLLNLHYDKAKQIYDVLEDQKQEGLKIADDDYELKAQLYLGLADYYNLSSYDLVKNINLMKNFEDNKPIPADDLNNIKLASDGYTKAKQYCELADEILGKIDQQTRDHVILARKMILEDIMQNITRINQDHSAYAKAMANNKKRLISEGRWPIKSGEGQAPVTEAFKTFEITRANFIDVSIKISNFLHMDLSTFTEEEKSGYQP